VALELRITRRAAADIERIAQWWQDHRPAAPGAVDADLQTALKLLLLQPGMGTAVVQAKSPGVRRFHLDRIRYYVYFRVSQNRLEVLAVWHSSRGSNPLV
jgi:plasmid stabilization system protein ParE